MYLLQFFFVIKKVMMGRGKGSPEPMKMYHEILIHIKKTFICFGIHIYREKRGDTSGDRRIFRPYPHCIQQPRGKRLM